MTRSISGWVLAFVLLVGTGSVQAEAVTSHGVEIPATVMVADTDLVRFGHGVARYAGIFRVYVAALYGPGDVPPDELLDRNVPRRLEITYLRSVAAADIREATDVVLAEQYSAEERADFADRFEAFNVLYEDVGEGDQYAYEYHPDGEQSRLYRNGELQGTVAGADFARAYLGIWLGDEPLSDSLKADLLGGRA